MDNPHTEPARILALEWLVRRLVAEHMIRSGNAIAEMGRWEGAIAAFCTRLAKLSDAAGDMGGTASVIATLPAEFADLLDKIGEEITGHQGTDKTH